MTMQDMWACILAVSLPEALDWAHTLTSKSRSHFVGHTKRDTNDYKWYFNNRIELPCWVTATGSGCTILRHKIVPGKGYEPTTRADARTNLESPIPGGIPTAEGVPTVVEMG
jgi:hypothetical protein